MEEKTKELLEQAIKVGLLRDRLDQKTAEELRKKDWKIVNNYAPVQKNRYLYAFEDVMFDSKAGTLLRKHEKRKRYLLATEENKLMSCSVRQLVLRHFSHDMRNEAIEKLEKETGQKWYKPTIADDLLINENGDVFSLASMSIIGGFVQKYPTSFPAYSIGKEQRKNYVAAKTASIIELMVSVFGYIDAIEKLINSTSIGESQKDYLRENLPDVKEFFSHEVAPLADYPMYLINDVGKIFSLHKFKISHMLNEGMDDNWRIFFHIRLNKKDVFIPTDYLVAKTFIDKDIQEEWPIAHLDGKMSNNSVDNLQPLPKNFKLIEGTASLYENEKGEVVGCRSYSHGFDLKMFQLRYLHLLKGKKIARIFGRTK